MMKTKQSSGKLVQLLLVRLFSNLLYYMSEYTTPYTHTQILYVLHPHIIKFEFVIAAYAIQTIEIELKMKYENHRDSL